MGVLVGTSLIVIIPEGIEAIYTAELGMHDPHARRTDLPARGLDVRWAHPSDPAMEAYYADSPRLVPDDSPLDEVGAQAEASPSDPNTHHSDIPTITPPPQAEKAHAPPTFLIGFSLISGFILMYLIDTLPKHATQTFLNHNPPPPRQIMLNNLSSLDPENHNHSSIPSSPLRGVSPHSGGNDDDEAQAGAASSFLHSFLPPSEKQARPLSTTLGLVIHACADGIALGASSTGQNSKLGLIVFLAIMVHKAPAAFGLTSVLLKQGLSKRAARAHLLVFSAAAPVGALGTWALVRIFGGGEGGGEGWTGCLLLFSGGTFLWVAMHAMQEDSHSSSEHLGVQSNGYIDGGQRQKARGPQMRDTVAAVAGMLLPLLTQIGHHH